MQFANFRKVRISPGTIGFFDRFMNYLFRISSNRLTGILYMLVASFLFAVMFALPKLADTGLNGLQATFMRYISGFITVLPFAFLISKRAAFPATSVWPLIVLRASAGVGAVSCIIYATTHMAYANALTISFTDGVFVIVLAGLVLRERILLRRWLAALACLAGAILVAQPSSDLLGIIWMEPAAKVALLGAFIMAGEVICIKHLTHRVAAPTLLLYTNGCAVLLAAPALFLFDWPDFQNLQLYALMGPIAILGQFFFMVSLRSDDVSALVPYKYSIILFSILLGIFIFGELPNAISVLGAGMIICAGVYLSRSEIIKLK